MEEKVKKNLIHLLLSDKLTWRKKRELSESEWIENRMRLQWEVADSEDDPVVKERIYAKIISRCNRPNRQVHRKLWSAVAASVAVILLIGSLWFAQKERAMEYIEFIAQGSSVYQLPDSSKVWMQPGSSIRYPKEFLSNRNVLIQGELIFEVKKQENSTFKVFIDKALIEVKGTCFRIKENRHLKSEITLFNGKVEFQAEDSKKRVTMQPHQKIIYNHLTKQVTLQNIENIDFQSEKYKFTEIRLDLLVSTINEMYNSQITIDKSVDPNYYFSGYIRYNEPLESIIEKICFNMGVRQKKENGNIIIYK